MSVEVRVLVGGMPHPPNHTVWIETTNGIIEDEKVGRLVKATVEKLRAELEVKRLAREIEDEE